MWRFPNFLIIVAMKSGNSSLHDYLNKHPDIFMSEPKEINYYAKEIFNLKIAGIVCSPKTELLISKMQADMIEFYKMTKIKFSKFKYDG